MEVGDATVRNVSRPLWMYWSRLAETIETPDGAGRIEVERGRAAFVRNLLTRGIELRSVAHATRRYEAMIRHGAEWPAIVVRTTGLETVIFARVSSTELAEHLADLLNRAAAEDARRPRSARHWFRTGF